MGYETGHLHFFVGQSLDVDYPRRSCDLGQVNSDSHEEGLWVKGSATLLSGVGGINTSVLRESLSGTVTTSVTDSCNQKQ